MEEALKKLKESDLPKEIQMGLFEVACGNSLSRTALDAALSSKFPITDEAYRRRLVRDMNFAMLQFKVGDVTFGNLDATEFDALRDQITGSITGVLYQTESATPEDHEPIMPSSTPA